LKVSFDECDSLTNKDCLTKDKKKTFFTQTTGDFFFVTLKNSQSFNREEYDETKLIETWSEMKWRPFSFYNRVQYHNTIQRNNAKTLDSFLNFGKKMSYDYFTMMDAETLFLSDKVA